jgi:hypothetical protein
MFVDRASRYKHTCNETNLMLYSSSVYFVAIPLHVSGFLVVYHQEAAMYICNKWYAFCVLVDCQLANQASWQSTETYNTYHLLPPDDGQLASPKHIEV